MADQAAGFIGEVADPREQWRITYDRVGQLWAMIVQRLDVTDSCRLWDDVKGSENLRGAINTLSECDFPYLPHSDTLKYLAERLDPEHLNEVLCKSFVCMRKAKRLSSFKGEYQGNRKHRPRQVANRNELQCSKKLRTGVGKHVWRVWKCRIGILHGRSAGRIDQDADDSNQLL